MSTRAWFSADALAALVEGTAPSPCGQPGAAADTAGTSVFVFGGWDGSSRTNDLHRLCLSGSEPSSWRWEQVQPRPPAGKGAAGPPALEGGQQLQLPCPRADNAMALWHYCDDGTWKDLLVVFGGSSQQGLLNDCWLFDIDTSSWTQVCWPALACTSEAAHQPAVHPAVTRLTRPTLLLLPRSSTVALPPALEAHVQQLSWETCCSSTVARLAVACWPTCTSCNSARSHGCRWVPWCAAPP